MAKLKWTKVIDFWNTAAYGCPTVTGIGGCPDFDDDGFKERIEKNQKMSSPDQATLQQAFFFRRLDIFNETTGIFTTKSKLFYPEIPAATNQPMVGSSDARSRYDYHFSGGTENGGIVDVLDFYNYDRTNKIGNIDIFEKITNWYGNDGHGMDKYVDRKKCIPVLVGHILQKIIGKA